MKKTFIINPYASPLKKEEIQQIEQDFQETLLKTDIARVSVNEDLMAEKEDLVHTSGRVIIKINTEGKNSHAFQDGTTIRLERKFNNFNRRETQAVNGVVLSAEGIPAGSEILIGHNALHDTNQIFNYKKTSGITEMTDIKYYSLPIDECFAWRNESGNLAPMKNFCFGLRVYEPYKGVLEGIEPTLIPEVLYITTGEFEGQVAHVLKASDYEIVFQGKNGREERVIRLRHFEDEDNVREEITAISGFLTERLNNGELLVGLTTSDAKPINVQVH